MKVILDKRRKRIRTFSQIVVSLYIFVCAGMIGSLIGWLFSHIWTPVDILFDSYVFFSVLFIIMRALWSGAIAFTRRK